MQNTIRHENLILTWMSHEIKKLTGLPLNTKLRHIREEAARVLKQIATEDRVIAYMDLYPFNPPLPLPFSRAEFEEMIHTDSNHIQVYEAHSSENNSVAA